MKNNLAEGSTLMQQTRWTPDSISIGAIGTTMELVLFFHFSPIAKQDILHQHNTVLYRLGR